MSIYSSVVLADGPIGYWRMDAASGTTETDRSGYGHDGTMVGTVTLLQAGVTGDGDAAALFSHSPSGRFDVTDAAVKKTAGPLTVEAWAKKGASVLGDAGIAGTGYSPTGFQINWNAGGTLYFNVGDNSLAGSAQYNASAFPVGSWHHFVGTWDGTTGAGGVTLYIDGALVATAAATTATLTATTFRIGLGSNYFDGTIDEVAVYSAALTATQVSTHYQAGLFRDINGTLQKYFNEVLYVGSASADLTTSLTRRMAALTGEATARMKSIIVSAGTKN